MATRKKFPTRRAGLLIDVARVISVGRDRARGRVVVRLRDETGRIVALRLRPRQFQTLANGMIELAEALGAAVSSLFPCARFGERAC